MKKLIRINWRPAPKKISPSAASHRLDPLPQETFLRRWLVHWLAQGLRLAALCLLLLGTMVGTMVGTVGGTVGGPLQAWGTAPAMAQNTPAPNREQPAGGQFLPQTPQTPQSESQEDAQPARSQPARSRPDDSSALPGNRPPDPYQDYYKSMEKFNEEVYGERG